MKKQTLKELTDEMSAYMRSVNHVDETIYRYHLKWRGLEKFMADHRIKYYGHKVGKAFVRSVLGDYTYRSLNVSDKALVNYIALLTNFQKDKVIKKGPKNHEPKVFKGEIGRLILNCINHRAHSLSLGAKTVQAHKSCLYQLYEYLNIRDIKHIKQLSSSIIQEYIMQMYPISVSKKHFSLNLLKIFFRYLFEEKILARDLSEVVPRDKYISQAKLPSTYTENEISNLLNSIDRGSPKGKRDYAMMLMAVKYGLRASDISALKFENINWENNIIKLIQYKTSKAIELPLLPEIGNAIIDYLKHGRPKSDEKYCFIHTYAPYGRLHNYDLGNLVKRYFQIANVDYSNRHHGPHAFRHSLASTLLKNETPLPTITAILGQSDQDSTMHYLKLDINSLRKCALDVPPIPCNYYSLKGGYRD